MRPSATEILEPLYLHACKRPHHAAGHSRKEGGCELGIQGSESAAIIQACSGHTRRSRFHDSSEPLVKGRELQRRRLVAQASSA